MTVAVVGSAPWSGALWCTPRQTGAVARDGAASPTRAAEATCRSGADVAVPPATTREARDRADLAAVTAGDRQALARLYERHREALFGFVLRTTSWDQGLAEEVLQDTLLAVWQHAASFSGEAQVRTWMYSIARRKALSKLRKRRPEPIDPEAVVPLADEGPDPADEALARLDATAVSRLIDQLPEGMRSVVVLAFVDDLPYQEISEIMEIPVGTIKSRVSRARVALGELAGKAGLR